MGIQSTQDISRQTAIDRIVRISSLISTRNYVEIEQASYDPDFDIEKFVEETRPVVLRDVELWTNTMLERKLDKPFFRWSMFDNYLIEEGDCS